MFSGNANAKDMVKRNLDQPVLAMFVRFVPKEWKSWPCMRVEVYGKPASKSKRGSIPLSIPLSANVRKGENSSFKKNNN